MAYDEHTADRIRKALAGKADFEEKKMFGGVAFMVRGHMTVGINKTSLMVRIGKDNHDEFVALPHAHVMDFTKKPMRGFLFVDPDGYQTDADLGAWLGRALEFNATMKAK